VGVSGHRRRGDLQIDMSCKRGTGVIAVEYGVDGGF
jgi:hypothetical protein